MKKVKGNIEAAKAYDILADHYDSSYDRPLFKAEDNVAIEWTKKLIPDDSTILDLGCGTGFFLDKRPNIQAYVGLDISDGMLKKARDKHQNATNYRFFLKGDMASVPLDAGTFDAVVSMFGSFSYAVNPKAVVEEIHRVLKPGGKFFVMVCSIQYLHRKNYLLARHGIEVDKVLYRPRNLELIFGEKFPSVKVYGLNAFPENMPFLPQRAMEWIMRRERNLFRRWGQFLIAEGEKQ